MLLLADDPPNREALAALIEGRSPEAFLGGSDVALITAALVALQFYGGFEYKGAKCHFVIGKKPSTDGLLKDPVRTLLRFHTKVSEGRSRAGGRLPF